MKVLMPTPEQIANRLLELFPYDWGPVYEQNRDKITNDKDRYFEAPPPSHMVTGFETLPASKPVSAKMIHRIAGKITKMVRVYESKCPDWRQQMAETEHVVSDVNGYTFGGSRRGSPRRQPQRTRYIYKKRKKTFDRF